MQVLNYISLKLKKYYLATFLKGWKQLKLFHPMCTVTARSTDMPPINL